MNGVVVESKRKKKRRPPGRKLKVLNLQCIRSGFSREYGFAWGGIMLLARDTIFSLFQSYVRTVEYVGWQINNENIAWFSYILVLF